MTDIADFRNGKQTCHTKVSIKHSLIKVWYTTFVLVNPVVHAVDIPIVIVTATLREESCQTNVILQYNLLTAILFAVCSIIQQS